MKLVRRLNLIELGFKKWRKKEKFYSKILMKQWQEEIGKYKKCEQLQNSFREKIINYKLK